MWRPSFGASRVRRMQTTNCRGYQPRNGYPQTPSVPSFGASRHIQYSSSPCTLPFPASATRLHPKRVLTPLKRRKFRAGRRIATLQNNPFCHEPNCNRPPIGSFFSPEVRVEGFLAGVALGMPSGPLTHERFGLNQNATCWFGVSLRPFFASPPWC